MLRDFDFGIRSLDTESDFDRLFLSFASSSRDFDLDRALDRDALPLDLDRDL